MLDNEAKIQVGVLKSNFLRKLDYMVLQVLHARVAPSLQACMLSNFRYCNSLGEVLTDDQWFQ